MKSAGLALLGIALVCGFYAVRADARAQYKSTVDKLTAETPAEKALQAKVKIDKCNACHIPKKSKKMRNPFGEKLHAALGGGDKTKYKYDKEFWKKGDDGNYSAAAIKSLRDAINAAAKEKE